MPPSAIGDCDVVMTTPPHPIGTSSDVTHGRCRPNLAEPTCGSCVPLTSTMPSHCPGTSPQPSFDDRYGMSLLNPNDGSIPTSILSRHDLPPAITLLSHVVCLGWGLPSSGNIIEERSFLHAYSQDVHDHQFLGHIQGPFTYAIEDDAFDDEESCERLEVFS